MKLFAVLSASAILAFALGAKANPPVCIPACDACHYCVQLSSPPGHLLPPTCAPKSPKPSGCP